MMQDNALWRTAATRRAREAHARQAADEAREHAIDELGALTRKCMLGGAILGFGGSAVAAWIGGGVGVTWAVICAGVAVLTLFDLARRFRNRVIAELHDDA